MKKILIVSMMIIIAAFVIKAPQVHAESTNYGTSWVATEIDEDVWAMELTVPVDLVTYDRVAIYISWPQALYSEFAAGGYDSQMILYDDAFAVEIWTLNAAFFASGYDMADGSPIGSMVLILDSTIDARLVKGNTTTTISGATESTSFYIRIMQSFANLPSLYDNTWRDNADFLVETKEFYIQYYSQLQLYTTRNAYGTLYAPDDPPAPPGFVFHAWKTSDGNIFVHEDASTVDESLFLEDGDGNIFINLYASFVSAYDPELEYDPTVTDNSPTGLLDILDAFGFDNDAGKTILFVFTATILTLLMLLVPAFRNNPFVLDVANIALTALFMFMGWLPVWVSIIVLAILLLVGLWTLGVPLPNIAGGGTNE
jgi:hypothetical protein